MPVATEHRCPAEDPTAIWRQMSAQDHRDWWANKAKPSDASPVALSAPCAVARPDSKSGSDDESECSTRIGGADVQSDSGDDDWA
eukprot:9310475-Alexandrium_andersonii.AAC.1